MRNNFYCVSIQYLRNTYSKKEKSVYLKFKLNQATLLAWILPDPLVLQGKRQLCWT